MGSNNPLPIDLLPDEPPAAQAAGARWRRPRRAPLPKSLPRVEQIIDVDEQDKRCGCGHDLVRIREDTSEKLDVIPPQVRVIRTVLPKYAGHHCDGSGDEEARGGAGGAAAAGADSQALAPASSGRAPADARSNPASNGRTRPTS